MATELGFEKMPQIGAAETLRQIWLGKALCWRQHSRKRTPTLSHFLTITPPIPLSPIAALEIPGSRRQRGVLSGPSFAQEVARGQPTALVAASAHEAVRDALVAAFHGPTLRVYAASDIVGVEVGGAVKNVLAIATGLCDGLQLGLNARAALITRGLAEMTRLGVALGARTETFTGLSGLGDLVLTATGDLSRNRKVGQALAQGQTLQQAVASLGHVAEGVYCARTVVQRASGMGIEMPISEGVVALLDGRISPLEAVALLMGRNPTAEL